MINYCRPIDLLKWLYEEGSTHTYTTDKAKAVYDKLDCIVRDYGPQFLYVEQDLIIASILNKLDPLFDERYNIVWDKVTFNLVDRYKNIWELVFTDSFTDGEFTMREIIDFESLGITDGKYYIADFIYNHS